MENFMQFKERINSYIWNGLYSITRFNTNPNLLTKIDESGFIRPFYGNTVVFKLPEVVNKFLGEIQDRLYSECGEMFAKPFGKETFHMTLHDLLNGTPTAELKCKVEQMKAPVRQIFDCINDCEATINLRTTALFNMVNTSMVLVVEPAEEESHNRLMSLYESFDKLVSLPYPLTPHITLAYFKPGVYGEELLLSLQRIIESVKEEKKIEFSVTLKMLEYQYFENMENYKKIL